MVGCETPRLANRPFFGDDVAEDDKTRQLEEANRALEARLLETERRLTSEREKALQAELKSREGQAVSAGVENALKDAQDKIRQGKREMELEAARQAAEGRARDLERRLAEEREMWVTMLKEHMSRAGDSKPLLQEIAALKTDIARRDEELSALKEKALKGGGDQKALLKENVSIKDVLAREQSLRSAREDEIKLLRQTLEGHDKEWARREENASIQLTSLQQALTQKEVEVKELRAQVDSARKDLEREGNNPSSPDVERDKVVLQKRLHEQQEFQKLEKEMGRRDALIQSVQAENESQKKKLADLTAGKDAETRLLRENLQRLGRQNKELLSKLQATAEAAPPPSLTPGPGPVNANLQDMMTNLEDALSNRDRMLSDQQKSIEEKRGLIEGLFGDLRSLDDQAVALLEEKNRQSEQMKERLASLSSENERLKRLLDSRPGAPPSP
jgi:DNA repair exonuclease SbcCD ATPase subunit